MLGESPKQQRNFLNLGGKICVFLPVVFTRFLPERFIINEFMTYQQHCNIIMGWIEIPEQP